MLFVGKEWMGGYCHQQNSFQTSLSWREKQEVQKKLLWYGNTFLSSHYLDLPKNTVSQ